MLQLNAKGLSSGRVTKCSNFGWEEKRLDDFPPLRHKPVTGKIGERLNTGMLSWDNIQAQLPGNAHDHAHMAYRAHTSMASSLYTIHSS